MNSGMLYIVSDPLQKIILFKLKKERKIEQNNIMKTKNNKKN